jgi:hypothetical protein
MALRHGVIYSQYRGHRLVADAQVEPITKEEVKAQIGLDASFTTDDTLLDIYIKSCRQYVESITGIAMIDQQWQFTLDHWPTTGEPWWDGVREGAIGDLHSKGRASDVFPPRYPLKTVDSLKVNNEALTVGDYFIVDTQQRPGRLALKSGASFPSVIDAANGIQITYTAGYGAAKASVPEPLRLGLMMMVAHLYGHRGDECSTENAYKMSGCKSMFEAYRIRGL